MPLLQTVLQEQTFQTGKSTGLYVPERPLVFCSNSQLTYCSKYLLIKISLLLLQKKKPGTFF